MNNNIFLFGVLSIFHVIGAVAMAYAVRLVWHIINEHDHSLKHAFFYMLWGSLLGCTPIMYGLDGQVPSWVLPTQVLVWGVVFVIATLFGWRTLNFIKPLFTISTGLITLGGLFVFAGLFSAFMVWHEDNGVLTAIVICGVFGIIGAGIFLLGLINLLKNRTS